MPSRRQQHIRKRVFTALLVLFLLIAGIAVFKSAKYFPALFQLFFKKEIELKGTKDNRVNILLLGVGGGTHEGPDLTDTIIFASLDPDKKKVTLVSVPRDLWVPEVKAKINASYTFGEEKKEGGGLVLTKAVMRKVINQQVDYAVKIDFNGFVKAVDMVGGLDIDVGRTFDDYQYPIEGREIETCGHTEEKIASLSAEIATGSASELDAFPCRYEHLHFDRGAQHMDGVTALKFVRSRHAVGPEGSDFARSQRQEKVISAFKDKVFSAGTLLNPVKVVSLMDVLQDSIDMDIKEDEYDDFVKLARKMESAKIESIALDTGDAEAERFGLLDNPIPSEEYGNQWVLIPRTGNGDFTEIHEYIACRISGKSCIIGANGILTPTPKVTSSAKKE